MTGRVDWPNREERNITSKERFLISLGLVQRWWTRYHFRRSSGAVFMPGACIDEIKAHSLHDGQFFRGDVCEYFFQPICARTTEALIANTPVCRTTMKASTTQWSAFCSKQNLFYRKHFARNKFDKDIKNKIPACPASYCIRYHNNSQRLHNKNIFSLFSASRAALFTRVNVSWSVCAESVIKVHRKHRSRQY